MPPWILVSALVTFFPGGIGVGQAASVDSNLSSASTGRSDRGTIEVELRRWTALTGRPELAGRAHWEVARLLTQLQVADAPRLASAGTRDGESYADAIMRHLAGSLRAKSTPEEARRAALDALLARGERAETKLEASVLRELLRLPAYRPEALIVHAREERQRGKLDSATETLQEARRLGLDPGLAAFEESRVHAAAGRFNEAAASYWASASRSTPITRSLLVQDLIWVASPDSVDDFRRLLGADARHWLEQFWAGRDADVAARPGDRLAEHLRRWAYVHEHFRVHIPDRRTQFARVEYGFEGFDQCVPNASRTYQDLATAATRLVLPGDIRADEPLLDHRAIVYMRHGAPALVVSGQGNGLPYAGRPIAFSPDGNLTRRGVLERVDEMNHSMFRNESWLYVIEGRWTFLHFRGSKALGVSAPTTLSTYLPVKPEDGGPFDEDWRLRAQILGEYGKAASIISRPPVDDIRYLTCVPEVRSVIASSRQSATDALGTDSDHPVTLASRNALVLHLGIGPVDGSGAVGLITYAIPASVLNALEGGADQRGTTLTIRTVARHLASGEVREQEERRDVGYRLDGRRDEYLTGHLEFPLGPGTWRIATRVTGPDGTVMAFGSDLDVPIPRAGAFAVSDLVIGRAEGPLRWQRGGEGVALDALDTWRTDQLLELYAELYGIESGESYELTVRVMPTDASETEGLAVVSNSVASRAPETIQRTVDFSRLPPGRYELSLQVRRGEAVVTSRRALILRKE